MLRPANSVDSGNFDIEQEWPLTEGGVIAKKDDKTRNNGIEFEN
jgi:hypothetical protein